MNRTTISLAAATLLILSAGASWAQSEKPDATIDYSSGDIAIAIGYNWGRGVLHFQGMDYPFVADGLSTVNVGAAGVRGTGNVYHLKKVADFPGTYSAIAAGVTVAGLAGIAMSNENNVAMHVSTTNQDLQLTLAPSNLVVAFDGLPTPSSSSP